MRETLRPLVFLWCGVAGSRSRYPEVRLLEVGEAVVIPYETPPPDLWRAPTFGVPKRIDAAIRAEQRRSGAKFEWKPTLAGVWVKRLA